MADNTPLRTTDATTTTLATIAPVVPAKASAAPDGFTVWEVRVLAVATDGSRAGYVRTFGVKHTSGTVALVGSVASPETFEDVSGWNCTVDVSSNVVRVRVTGAAATTINWYLQHAGPVMGMGPAPSHTAIPVGCAWSV